VHVSKVERINYQNIPQTHILPQRPNLEWRRKKKKIERERRRKRQEKTVWNKAYYFRLEICVECNTNM